MTDERLTSNDEEFVRSVWKNVKSWVRDLDSYGTNQFNVGLFLSSKDARWDDKPFQCWQNNDDLEGVKKTWKQARKFTEKVQSKIKDIEAELLWMEAESTMSDGFPSPEELRIISREQAHLTELKRGMKPPID